jgi:hypothetical protein
LQFDSTAVATVAQDCEQNLLSNFNSFSLSSNYEASSLVRHKIQIHRTYFAMTEATPATSKHEIDTASNALSKWYETGSCSRNTTVVGFHRWRQCTSVRSTLPYETAAALMLCFAFGEVLKFDTLIIAIHWRLLT